VLPHGAYPVSTPFTVRTCPAFVVAILCLAGTILAHSALLSDRIMAILFGSAFLLSVLLFWWQRHPGLLLLTVAILCAAMGAMKYTLDCSRTTSLDPLWADSTITLKGRITWEPESNNRRIRFLLAGEEVLRGKLSEPFVTTVMVTVLTGRADSAKMPLMYGMDLLLTGRLDRPSEERNPGEMSPRAYDEANGITHLLLVRGYDNIRIRDSASSSMLMGRIILPARRWILKTFDETVGGQEGEFLKGLIIGERGGLSQELKEAFVNAGVAHVLAVSGSNVAVIASILFLVFELIRIPRTLRSIAVMVGLVGYMLITGSQPPVVRATVTASIMLCGSMIQRRSSPYNALGVAVLVILGVDARQTFDVGFQLSFVAVLSIVHFYPIANSWIAKIHGREWWIRWGISLLRVCAVSLVATLGTLPITAVWFGRVSVIGILANIVVIPATGLSVLLGAAGAAASLVSPWAASAYGALNWLVLHWTLVVTRLAGFSSVAYIDTFRFGACDALPYYVLLLLFFHWGEVIIAWRFVLILAAANGFVLLPQAGIPPPANRLRVNFIDVGQGDAMLAEFPGRYFVLLDAGPRTAEDDAGKRVVVPYLKRCGVDHLDLVIISHPHADHAGGIPSVLHEFPVARVVAQHPSLASAALREFGGDGSVLIDSVRAGENLLGTSMARLYVVYPIDGQSATSASGNESLVLKLQYGVCSFLLTGDAERDEERCMVDTYGSFLHATVLKAGHHGSNTSSSEPFLECVRPNDVVISVGKYNRFHHPSPAMIGRARSRNATVLRTDESGAIIVDTDGNSLQQVEWR